MKDLHQVLFYFDVLPFLSLLLSFLPSFFSPVAHFRLRSAASGLKATLRVSSLPTAGPLCQTDRTYSHAENAGCGHEVYLNQTPPKLLHSSCKPDTKNSSTLGWVVLVVDLLIYSKTTFLGKDYKEVVSHPKILFLYTSTLAVFFFVFFFWKWWKLEVILLFYTWATIGQVSCLRLPVRLSLDLLLLPNIEKNCIHTHSTTLAWLLHTLYSQAQKQGNRSVFFFMRYHLSSLMLLLFVFRKQYQTCAHVSYSDTLCGPTVQPCLLKMMFTHNWFVLAETLCRL